MVSIFSPVYDKVNKFLPEAYQSLCDQTDQDWEWIICLNNGGQVSPLIQADERVRVFETHDDQGVTHNRIGRLKKLCCERARGIAVLEFDADDLLMPTAVEKVRAAFADPNISFVGSNDALFHDGTWEPRTFSEYYGWRSRPFEYQGKKLIEMVGWEPGPQMMRMIFWAPDHLRAWRLSDYLAIGGHDESMVTGDDHDLLCRTYLAFGAARMKHLDECLYLYRITGDNSSVWNNAEVQQNQWDNYLKYAQPMAERWARDNGLRLLDIGGGIDGYPGYEKIDIAGGADIICDLEGPWPFEDNSVGVIRASHVLEHLSDPIHAMNEAFRCLAGGGFFFIDIPSTDGRGAFQDPTHKSFWKIGRAHV